MKITVLLTLGLMFVGCNLRQGDKTGPTSPKKGENQRQLEVNEEIHNFGTLKAGEIVVCSLLRRAIPAGQDNVRRGRDFPGSGSDSQYN